MKILQVYKTYYPESRGGIEQVINQIARGISKKGITAEVFTLTKQKLSTPITIDAHTVHRAPTTIEIASTPFSVSAISQFKQLVKEADVIHYHFPYPFADCLHFLTRVKKPTVLTYHCDIIKQKYLAKLYNPLRKQFLNSVSSIVVTSPNYLQSSDDLKPYYSKTKLIPIGLNQETYPMPSQEKLRFWQERFGPRFFLFLGVIRYYKGLQFLIEAARRSEYPIVIAGFGPLIKEYQEMVRNQGITNIHFVGEISSEDKVALFQLCYAFVFPSHLRSEGFGIALLEGAMFGKPLISCEIATGTSYINIQNETGFVVPPANVEALKKAMDYLWDNPDEASKMGIRARSRFEDIFEGQKMIESYIELYNTIGKKR
jgi:glycosyltransferase involved in cell wall biosynthesis